MVYLLIGVVSWPVLRIVFRLRWSGRESVPTGGCVVAANHWSNFDPWPLGIPLFPHRFLRFMAKKELFWPPLGWIIRAGGGFRVDRGAGDLEALRTAVDLCRAGHAVVNRRTPTSPRGPHGRLSPGGTPVPPVAVCR